MGIQAGLLHPQRDGETFAPGDFVAEDQQEQIVMGHLLLARESQPLRERIEMRESFSRRITVFRSGLMTSGVSLGFLSFERRPGRSGSGDGWRGVDTRRAEYAGGPWGAGPWPRSSMRFRR